MGKCENMSSNENSVVEEPPTYSETQQQSTTVVQQPQVVVAGIQLLPCHRCKSQVQVIYREGVDCCAVLCCICFPIIGCIYCCTLPDDITASSVERRSRK